MRVIRVVVQNYAVKFPWKPRRKCSGLSNYRTYGKWWQMIKLSYWLVGLILCIPINVRGQEVTGPQLLRKVGELYTELKSYSFEGMAIWEKQSEGSYERREFPFLKVGKEPARNLYEAGWPRKRVSFCIDEESAWIYLASNNQYARGKLEEVLQVMRDLPGMSELTTVKSYLRDYWKLGDLADGARLVGEENLELEGRKLSCYLVEYNDPMGQAKAGPMEVSPKKIWIEKTGLVILKEVAHWRFRPTPGEPFTDATETFILTSFQVNQPIEESRFAFHAPAQARSLISSGGSISSASSLLGEAAPAFSSKSLDGKEYTLEKFKGQVLLLDFWASWCKPCRVEMPIVEKLYQEYKNKGLVVLGINDENPELMREFLRESRVNFPLLVDDGEIMHSFKIRAIPTLIMLDREGKIAWHHVGTSGEGMLRRVLEEAGLK